MVVQQLAMDRPDLVDRLILVSTDEWPAEFTATVLAFLSGEPVRPAQRFRTWFLSIKIINANVKG